MASIKAINGLTSDNLSIGQVLKIPSGTSAASTTITKTSSATTTPTGIRYVVKSGDSLWLIARKYGVTIDYLIQKNNLTTDLLSIGQILYI